MSIPVPPLPTREQSPSDRAECKGCYKKIAFGITRVKEHWSRYPMYYHEGCCTADTVAAMQESEADHPEDIRKKLHFLINPDETVKQQNFAMSVFLNSMQGKLSSVRYALSMLHGGKQEEYIKWNLLKTIAYKLPTSKKELLDAGIDPPVVKKHGDSILGFVTDLIKGKEGEMNREDPALAYLRSLMPPVAPMEAQPDAGLRDEPSAKKRKTDDVTQLDQNNEDDLSTAAVTETLTNEEAVARRVKEAEQNGNIFAVE